MSRHHPTTARLVDRHEARQIAETISNPGDASFNKIAYFAETGTVETGLAQAVRDYPGMSGEIRDADRRALIRFAENIEAEEAV